MLCCECLISPFAGCKMFTTLVLLLFTLLYIYICHSSALFQAVLRFSFVGKTVAAILLFCNWKLINHGRHFLLTINLMIVSNDSRRW